MANFSLPIHFLSCEWAIFRMGCLKPGCKIPENERLVHLKLGAPLGRRDSILETMICRLQGVFFYKNAYFDWGRIFSSTATNKHPTCSFRSFGSGCRGAEALPKDLDEVNFFSQQPTKKTRIFFKRVISLPFGSKNHNNAPGKIIIACLYWVAQW